jgi:chaperone modulatory protein CbpM
MAHLFIAKTIDEERISVDELELTCAVGRDWVVQHVEAGVLPADMAVEPERWVFGSRDLIRARRLQALERDFDANPELAGLVADLLDEVERLRTRLRRAG